MAKCPVCLGKGQVLENFYKKLWEELSEENPLVECQQCQGEGEVNPPDLKPEKWDEIMEQIEINKAEELAKKAAQEDEV